MLKNKVNLPHPLPVKDKIAIIREDLPDDIINNLSKNEKVELLTVAEVRQKVEGKKRSQWNFTKLLAHSHSEAKIKTLEKILGAKGIYPNKKNGSLTESVLEEIEKFYRGER